MFSIPSFEWLVVVTLFGVAAAWSGNNRMGSVHPTGFRTLRSRRPSVVSCRSQINDDVDEDGVEVFRAKLMRTYQPQSAIESLRFGDDYETEDWGLSCDPLVPGSCGEEECEIPAAFKVESQMNVMDFLGIKRAEPLRKRSSRNDFLREDWE